MAALLVAVTVFPARASTPHVLRYADQLDVSSLNPFLATTGNIQALSELTMASFVRFDAKGNAIPELITAIPTQQNGGVSADGKTIVYHLRRGVRWSDGAPFDADDVVYTYRVASDPANNIPVRDPWTRLSGVEARDRYTVVFHFKAPYALFITDYFAAGGTSCILPKHTLGPTTAINDAPYNAQPVGIGPFRYTAYHRGDDVEMEANPYYWRGKPKLQRIVYKIVTDSNVVLTQLETGELDFADEIEGTLADRAKALPCHRTAARLSSYQGGLFFNVTRPATGDVRVRRALILATDRAAILHNIAFGVGVLTQSLVSRTSIDYLDLPLARYDPVRAGALLDAAGWKRGADGVRRKNGVPLALDFVIPAGYGPSVTLANVLHDEWGRVGITVNIHAYANAQFFAPLAAGGIINTGKYDVANYAEGTGPLYANVNGLYDCAGIPPNGFNTGRYCNRRVDALNERYVHSFDPLVRRRVSHEMQHVLDADAPAGVLYERLFLAAFDARLTGYHANSFSYWGDPLELDI